MSQEDVFDLSTQIAQCAFMSGQEYLMKKFSSDAVAKGSSNDSNKVIAQILDALSFFMKNENKT